MKGTVKWFNTQRGYGFIKDSDGNDIFCHYTGVISDKNFKTCLLVKYIFTNPIF